MTVFDGIFAVLFVMGCCWVGFVLFDFLVWLSGTGNKDGSA